MWAIKINMCVAYIPCYIRGYHLFDFPKKISESILNVMQNHDSWKFTWLVVLLIRLQCIFYWNELQWTYRIHCIYSAMKSTNIAFNENCRNYSRFHNRKSMSYRSFLWRFFLYESPRVFLFLRPRVIRQDPPLRQRAMKLLKRVDFVVRRQASGWVWSMEESRWLVFGTAFWHRM